MRALCIVRANGGHPGGGVPHDTRRVTPRALVALHATRLH